MALHDPFILPTFHWSLLPFNHLFSYPLNRSMNLSLLVAFNITHRKSVEALPHFYVFFLHFKFWSFFIQLKTEKIIVYYKLFMANVPLIQKPGNLFELIKVSEKCLRKSDIFSKDVARGFVYLLKTLHLSILQVQVNYLSPKNELNFCL